jgi:hypothetical protein
VSEPLSEYELALTAYGLKRRLWAERYLGFPKPPHQLKYPRIVASLFANLLSKPQITYSASLGVVE